jgi:hypothetical protein
MRDLLAELYRRNRLLTLVGWLHVGLLIVAFGLAAFDSRAILGINPWIKPMKFMASITIFVWTVAWLLGYLPGPRWAVRTISVGVSLAMVIEIICISLQSARGTTSHFNGATPFDGIAFGVMGLMIVFNSLLVAWVGVLFFTQKVQLDVVYLWGIRLGLLVFLLGSAEGGVMVGHNAHTVGAPDGGPGLPITNWSTQAGDLRVAHMLGLHALQILPLTGYLLGRWSRPLGQRMGILAICACIYLAATVGLFIHAANGLPLVRL